MTTTKVMLAIVALASLAAGCAAEVSDEAPSTDAQPTAHEAAAWTAPARWSAGNQGYCPPGRVDRVGGALVFIPSICVREGIDRGDPPPDGPPDVLRPGDPRMAPGGLAVGSGQR